METRYRRRVRGSEGLRVLEAAGCGVMVLVIGKMYLGKRFEQIGDRVQAFEVTAAISRVNWDHVTLYHKAVSSSSSTSYSVMVSQVSTLDQRLHSRGQGLLWLPRTCISSPQQCLVERIQF